MSEQITPNPSVPTQIIQEVKFPQFVNNLGIIPTSYKDSMSYYETLAWLCKYLEETVIPSVNQNGNAVQELQGLYIELNSYVDNYFENLDVQEEINNKLDEMVANGTLDEIIGNYFDPKIASLQSQINSLASGAPLSASSTAGMTDTTRIYVNTSDGYWYYYNGEAWTRGEIYQATIQSIDYKNQQTATITAERSLHTFDLIQGHHYRFFNTSTVSNLTVSSREPDQVTPIETFVANLKHGRYVEFVPTQTTNCLFIVANDLTSTSYTIIDLDTIDERIIDNKEEIENFTLNNLSDLAKKYFTKGYTFKEYTKYFQKVAITQNNVVTLVNTDYINCFSVIIDLDDFTNSLHIALQTSKFDAPIYRYYLVKEDNTYNLHNWSAIEGDIFMSLTKEQLDTLTTAGWKYIYITISNSTDGTFINDASLPLEFDFYVYDTKPDEATRFNNIIIVDPNGNGDYETIAEAVSAASNYDTIYIRKGTYSENIECTEKTLYFIGEDKYEVVIQSTNGTYENPPLEIACGIVKNMTIKAEYVSGTSVTPEAGSPGAYGIHADYDNGDHFLTIENCIVSSDFFPAIGIGLFDDKTLEIKDCTLISNQDTYGTYINDGTLGALYFHNRAGTNHHNQKIIVSNCKLQSKKENVLCPYDVPGDSGVSELTYEFNNNILYSETNGYTNNIWWRNGQLNFTKSPLSYGNSNPSLNAS